MEYDTGGYLARWFEGYLVPSRSTTYGLFLAAGWPLDFWPIVILQAIAAVWIIGLLLADASLSAHPVGAAGDHGGARADDGAALAWRANC